MWNRACPLCFTKVPPVVVLTRTDEVDCPSCRTPLELSRASRVLGAWVRIAGGVCGHANGDLEQIKGDGFCLMVAADNRDTEWLRHW